MDMPIRTRSTTSILMGKWFGSWDLGLGALGGTGATGATAVGASAGLTAAVNLAGMAGTVAVINSLSNTDEDDTESNECTSCELKYPEYKKCSMLYGYNYRSKREAFLFLGGHRLDGARAAHSGPCAGTPGQGSHWNVKDRFGGRAGSIVSCTCCQEGSAVRLATKYKAVF